MLPHDVQREIMRDNQERLQLSAVLKETTLHLGDNETETDEGSDMELYEGLFSVMMSSSDQVILMIPKSFKVLCWNARGLGADEKCNVIKNVIKESRYDICCIQETKWGVYDPRNHARVLPTFFERDCAILLARGTKWGTIISWKRCYSLINSWTITNKVSVVLKQESSGTLMIVTSVYEPSDDDELKKAFMQELSKLSALITYPWILLGDFNLVRRLTDRPRDPTSMALMSLFNDLIRDLEIINIPLTNRAYTWCSKRPVPTFSHTDRVFMTPGWAQRFPTIRLEALEMSVSDHCPLLLICGQRHTTKKEPKWENF